MHKFINGSGATYYELGCTPSEVLLRKNRTLFLFIAFLLLLKIIIVKGLDPLRAKKMFIREQRGPLHGFGY